MELFRSKGHGHPPGPRVLTPPSNGDDDGAEYGQGRTRGGRGHGARGGVPAGGGARGRGRIGGAGGARGRVGALSAAARTGPARGHGAVDRVGRGRVLLPGEKRVSSGTPLPWMSLEDKNSTYAPQARQVRPAVSGIHLDVLDTARPAEAEEVSGVDATRRWRRAWWVGPRRPAWSTSRRTVAPVQGLQRDFRQPSSRRAVTRRRRRRRRQSSVQPGWTLLLGTLTLVCVAGVRH